MAIYVLNVYTYIHALKEYNITVKPNCQFNQRPFQRCHDTHYVL